MGAENHLSSWQRWVRQPQKIWIRRALFQVHLWTGLIVGIYILMISLTGSVLVFRNELARAATHKPVISTSSLPRLSDSQLADAARLAYPGYRVVRMARGRNPDQAVDVYLARGNKTSKRLFDPRTGSDLGDAVPIGIRIISTVSDLHDNLFFGESGRSVNGAGAYVILAILLTGLVVWWPGIKTWRRSLFVRRGVGWKRGFWHWHSMIGFWTFAFSVIFCLSGIYLCFPERFQDVADRLTPVTGATGKVPFADQVIYWLAYLHFGRIGGIGIPCSGPGFCDKATKTLWALFGAAPAAMAVTGAILWWNRVVRPRLARERRAVEVAGNRMEGELAGGDRPENFASRLN